MRTTAEGKPAILSVIILITGGALLDLSILLFLSVDVLLLLLLCKGVWLVVSPSCLILDSKCCNT